MDVMHSRISRLVCEKGYREYIQIVTKMKFNAVPIVRSVSICVGGLSYSAVLKVVERMPKKLQKGRALKRRLMKIEERLSQVMG